MSNSRPSNPDEMLSKAIANKSVIEAEEAIKNDVDLQFEYFYESHHRGTHLAHALRVGQYEMIELLINAVADVNKADDMGVTPLMLAARYGNDRAVTLLLKNGATVDYVDDEGQTALFYASSRNKLDIIELLVNAGADIKLENKVKTLDSVCIPRETRVFLRNLLSERNNSLMEKLKEFETLREQQLKKEYSSEEIAQKFAKDISETTWKSSANNVRFLREHMDLLPINFKDVRNYLFDSAELLNLISADALPEEEREKFDSAAHAMRDLAATLGHKDAKRIVDVYKKDKETTTIQDENEKSTEPSPNKLNIVALPSSKGIFSSEQKNARTSQSDGSQKIDNSSNSSSASIGFRNTSSSSSQD